MWITKKKHNKIVDGLKVLIDEAKKANEAQIRALRQENSTLRFEHAELKAIAQRAVDQHREQTEADLYFTCEKIKQDLLSGKKVEEVEARTLRQREFQSVLNDIARDRANIGSFSYQSGIADLAGNSLINSLRGRR